MSQKEDILEQIVEEYLTHRGYFVQHNIKYRPSKTAVGYNSKADSVHSDIDVLGYNPVKKGPNRVVAVTIKSWQEGFDFRSVLNQIESNKVVAGKASQLRYRELCIPKWSDAFIEAIKDRTGERRFTYVLAVTRAKGDAKVWTSYRAFTETLKGNPLEVWTLQEMVDAIESGLTKTPAATDIGRTLQLFRAAGLRPKPTRPETSVEISDD
jgi:hypothetical protein